MVTVNPTRINLINTKKNIVLAKKGHSLLKRKREVLVLEFLNFINKFARDRDYLYPLLQEGYKKVAIASSYVGDFELDRISTHIKEPKPVKITEKNIMGVRIPNIERSSENLSILERGYSLMSTDVSIDDINESFNEIVNVIIEVAKREQSLKRIVLEIEKVKRRVNALEYILLPDLDKRSKYIVLRLEEIDRDAFSALKHVKKRLQKTEENNF
ncbi:MAG: V-type ATP synthase subunit D [Candidatus Micrarchaeia archaeon]